MMTNNGWATLGVAEKELDRLLSRAKINLIGKKNAIFLASIMSQTRFLWDWSIPTAQTNGEWIKINPQFFHSLPGPSRITVVAHELLHIAYGHMARIKSRNGKKWNIAGDHVINLTLIADGYSFKNLEWAWMDPQFKNMSTERVYDLLPDPPPGPCMNQGKPVPMADDVEEVSGIQKQNVMSKVVKAQQAAKISKSAGDIPGEITMILERFLNPIIPWQIVLRDFFVEQAKSDYSYRRPSRRYEDIIMPSLIGEDGLTHLNFYQDISGSVSDADILRSHSEVAHVKNEYDPERLDLITFDTDIHDTYTFLEGEKFEKVLITGRGGTSLSCVRKHILTTQPKAAIIFSDLDCRPMKRVDIPVLWIKVGNIGHEPDWGTLIRIDNEDEF